MVGTSGPEQLGLIKFPASAIDITPVLQMRKLPHSPWADLLEINNVFLSAFLSHLHMLSLCCQCLNLYVYLYLYWSSRLVCFKGSNLTRPKWNSALPPGRATPRLLCPSSWHFIHLSADTTSLRISWILSYSSSCHQNHQSVLFSRPLDLFGTALRLFISTTYLPTLNRHHLLHCQSLLHTVVRWPFINKSERVTFFYRSFLYESKLGFMLGSVRFCMIPASPPTSLFSLLCL